MTTKRESVQEFIIRMGDILANANHNDKINAAIALFGYDASKLAEGQALLDALVDLTSRQVDEYAEQYAATSAANQAWETADKALEVNRAIAKRLFAKDKLAQGKLLLKDAKPTKQAEWVFFASHFYTRLLENGAWLGEMGQFGRTTAVLTQGLALVEEAQRLFGVQQDEMAEAQTATQARDAAWGQARAWLGAFLEVAVFALADEPQLLEAFHKVIPS